MSGHANGQQRSLAIPVKSADPSLVITRSNVKGAANTTTKSVGIAGLRGATAYPRGVERVGVTTEAMAMRTSVATRDARIACHRIKVRERDWLEPWLELWLEAER